MRWVGMAAAGVIGACVITAADPDYFPLAVGNRWEYQAAGGGRTAVAEVLSSEVIQGKTWFQVRWLNEKQYWLRMDDQQRLMELNRGPNTETLWVDFRGAGVFADGARVSVCRVPVVNSCRMIGLPYAVYRESVGLVESGHGGDPEESVLRLVKAHIAGKDLTF